MRMIACLLGAWLGVLVPASVTAAEVKTLFEAEVEVRGTDEAARNAAFRDALKMVLRRLVRRESLGDPGARAMLAEAPRYVRQFEPVASPGGEAAPSRLRVAFAGPALLQALKARDIPAWGTQRPEVLVWLVAEENGQRQWAMDAEPEVLSLLEQAASEHGLPLRLPNLDETDRRALGVDAVANGADEAIRAASARHGSATILAGRLLRKSENRWETAWRFYQGEELRIWNEKAASLPEAVRAGLSGAYDTLAMRGLLTEATESSVLEVEIAEVRGSAVFQRARHILESLDGARAVELVRVTPDAATFRLELPGGQEALSRQTAATGELTPVEGGAETAPRYRLAR
jgi:hypothetical protein